MSDEDELVAEWLSTHSEREDATCTVEEHYNHYGDRGVVDLVIETEGKTTLVEMKSEAAVKAATGANEIIRQCKRHAEYYFKDKTTPRGAVKKLCLVFYTTPLTWQHLLDNIDMYRSFYDRQVSGCYIDVSFSHPDADRSIKPLHPVLGYETDRFEEQLDVEGQTALDAAGVDL